MKSLLVAILAIATISCASTKDLDTQIQAKKSEIEVVSRNLNEVKGPTFETTHDMQAALRVATINAWLHDVSAPEFAITAIGVRRVGDLVYKGGIGKAWIEPERDTKLRLSLTEVSADTGPSRITWSADIAANAESRVYFYILNVGGNILCEGRVQRLTINGALALKPVVSTKVPYTMSLTSPPNIPINASCGLGRLGNYSMPFNAVVTDISSGNFDLGFKLEGDMEIPTTSQSVKYHYTINPKDSNVDVLNGNIEYRTNLGVTVKPQ